MNQVVQRVDQHGPHRARFLIRSDVDLRISLGLARRHSILSDVSELDRSSIVTMLSELGTNILKYAREGTLQLERLERAGAVQIKVLAEDQGPGIQNIDRAMEDMYSASGTLGLGLPSVRRMSDHFSIENTHQGLRVVAEKFVKVQTNPLATSRLAFQMSELIGVQGGTNGGFEYAVGRKGFGGSRFVGDLALMLPANDEWLLAIIDATGHGETAFKTASSAAMVIADYTTEALELIITQVHESLYLTEGVALGLVRINEQTGRFVYAAVGNTRAELVGAKAWRGVSIPGIVGQRLGKPMLQEGQLQPGDLLFLSTDGIDEFKVSSTLTKHRVTGLQESARRVLTQYSTQNDDACCLMVRGIA